MTRDYESVDPRIPLLKGVANGRDWGRTVITMAKFKNDNTTFEDMVRMAFGGSVDHIKYLSFIKERFKAKSSNEPSFQGPDLAAFLYYYIKFQPPAVASAGYQRTYR